MVSSSLSVPFGTVYIIALFTEIAILGFGCNTSKKKKSRLISRDVLFGIRE